MNRPSQIRSLPSKEHIRHPDRKAGKILILKSVMLKDLQALHKYGFDLLLRPVLFLVALPGRRMSENAEDLAANQKSQRNVPIEISNNTDKYCLLDPK